MTELLAQRFHLLRRVRVWRLRTSARRVLMLFAAGLLLYGMMPYIALWKLDRALVRADYATLAAMVNMDAVREEIGRRLNKDRPSRIGEVSPQFIRWLETGLRRHGVSVLNDLVTLEWFRDQLVVDSTVQRGFLGDIRHAFFTSPLHVRVHVARSGHAPVTLHLHLGAMGWRVTVLSY